MGEGEGEGLRERARGGEGKGGEGEGGEGAGQHRGRARDPVEQLHWGQLAAEQRSDLPFAALLANATLEVAGNEGPALRAILVYQLYY